MQSALFGQVTDSSVASIIESIIELDGQAFKLNHDGSIHDDSDMMRLLGRRVDPKPKASDGSSLFTSKKCRSDGAGSDRTIERKRYDLTEEEEKRLKCALDALARFCEKIPGGLNQERFRAIRSASTAIRKAVHKHPEHKRQPRVKELLSHVEALMSVVVGCEVPIAFKIELKKGLLAFVQFDPTAAITDDRAADERALADDDDDDRSEVP